MSPADMKYDAYLSVVIPTYNEADRLPRTLDEIVPYLDARFRQFDILIVDDESPDGTAKIVLDRSHSDHRITLLKQPGRLGKGAAVRRGCLEAAGALVLFMDADHATPIQELGKMLPLIEQSGVVVGVRTYQEDEPKWRRVVGLIAQLLAHLIVFRKAVVDSQCGFKLFTRDAAQQLFPYCRVDGGMLDVELFFLMHEFGVPCAYQAVHWKNKSGSKISVLRCMLTDPWEMIKIRLRDLAGLYRRPLSADMQPWKRN